MLTVGWCQHLTENTFYTTPSLSPPSLPLSSLSLPPPPPGRDNAPALDALALGGEASSGSLLLQLGLQDQVGVFTSVSGLNFGPDWLIHLLSRYLTRLKEDDEACAEALQRAQVFLFHRLSPLLHRSERGTFRAVGLMSSGTHRVPVNHRENLRNQSGTSDILWKP